MAVVLEKPPYNPDFAGEKKPEQLGFAPKGDLPAHLQGKGNGKGELPGFGGKNDSLSQRMLQVGTLPVLPGVAAFLNDQPQLPPPSPPFNGQPATTAAEGQANGGDASASSGKSEEKKGNAITIGKRDAEGEYDALVKKYGKERLEKLGIKGSADLEAELKAGTKIKALESDLQKAVKTDAEKKSK